MFGIYKFALCTGFEMFNMQLTDKNLPSLETLENYKVNFSKLLGIKAKT
jgi:hypothetical protein